MNVFTSNQCILVTNAVEESAVVSCACELMQLCSVSLELCINVTSGLLETAHQTIGEL
jgi:hypothetical protein